MAPPGEIEEDRSCIGETGSGYIAKLVTQYLGYANFVTALEGLLIGAKAGVDLCTLV
jgi:3-hydroxyisobutyrate dehydrogenase-like beta-hydroxyacid dehydrogenase